MQPSETQIGPDKTVLACIKFLLEVRHKPELLLTTQTDGFWESLSCDEVLIALTGWDRSSCILEAIAAEASKVVLDSLKEAAFLANQSNFLYVRMATWFHCNSCYFRPNTGSQRRFFITNCSHVYCEDCVTAATKEKCKVCKSQCSTLCLQGKLPKEVESLFMDPLEGFQKCCKEMFQRFEFQKSQQKRLWRHQTEQINSIEKKLGQVNKMIEQFQQMERAYLDVKSQRDYLQLLLSKKDGCSRSGSRSGTSPGVFQQSPSQTSLVFGKNQNFTTLLNRAGTTGGGPNIAPGRLLMRTPPSGGRLGTVGGPRYTPTMSRSNNTPESHCGTPLTIPRPIHFNKTD